MPIDEEKVRQAIEVSQSSFPQVTGSLRIFLLGIVIVFLGLGIIILLLPSLEKMGQVLIINPVADFIIKVIVWCLLVFVVLGIVCIFSKAARLPSFIILAVYLIGFGILAEVNWFYTRLDYRLHHKNKPELRECVVILRKAAHNGTIFLGEDLDEFVEGEEYYHFTFYLTLRFTDTGKEQEFQSTNTPMPFFNSVREGGTYNIRILHGSMKLQYITSITQSDK